MRAARDQHVTAASSARGTENGRFSRAQFVRLSNPATLHFLRRVRRRSCACPVSDARCRLTNPTIHYGRWQGRRGHGALSRFRSSGPARRYAPRSTARPAATSTRCSPASCARCGRRTPLGGAAVRALLVGAGAVSSTRIARGGWEPQLPRHASSDAGVLRRSSTECRHRLSSCSEGAVLGNFDNGHYKNSHEERFFVSQLEIAGGHRRRPRSSAARASAKPPMPRGCSSTNQAIG